MFVVLILVDVVLEWYEAQQEWHNRMKPTSLRPKHTGGERETLCGLSHIIFAYDAITNDFRI